MKQELLKQGVDIPLKVVVRDEHIWMGFRLRLLIDYWPHQLETFTPGVLNSEGRLFRMDSHLNTTNL